MSIDTVDDLHAAEDTIGQLTAVLATIDECSTALPDVARGALAAGLAVARDYCRPSCYQDEPGGPWECEDDCGCPGQHDASHDDR